MMETKFVELQNLIIQGISKLKSQQMDYNGKI